MMRNLTGGNENFRKKYKILEKSAMILIFPEEIQKKLIEKQDNLHPFTNIFDKLREKY